jgi:hypothetical protein
VAWAIVLLASSLDRFIAQLLERRQGSAQADVGRDWRIYDLASPYD